MRLGLLVQLVQPEHKAQQAQQAQLDRPVLMVRKAQPELLVHKALPERVERGLR